MGIDYGNGQTNVSNVMVAGTDEVIRFGVISLHEVMQAWCEDSEAYYGHPQCPYCGAELDDDVDDDYECECGHIISWVDEECYGEAVSFYYDRAGYQAESDSYGGDIFITKSPYYTLCGFCSPCAPGAGYLTDAGNDCKEFCFGPDWFDGPAPHDIYSVATGKLVYKKGDK